MPILISTHGASCYSRSEYGTKVVAAAMGLTVQDDICGDDSVATLAFIGHAVNVH